MDGEEGLEALVGAGEGCEAAIKEKNDQDEKQIEAHLPAAERGPSPMELLTEMTSMPPAHLAAAVVVLVRHHFKLGGGAWPSWPPALAAVLPFRASDPIMRFLLTDIVTALEADRRDIRAARLNRLWDARFAKLEMKPGLPTGP
ncbi:hypothetical protein GPECTOR_1g146 [Gonium pectorale]|uniref:Uncharacterized protein n=1 Tax=Gonium pectorale TaxID=33097 RepID=A0A150H3N5_GONPE|nr:hypothetical protein GPECTOR_1g146 [Gonium pectorale]|eukprot:KXZ56170.1 hypothetical protein GPECTOR_1g146 [Gonium pectorale]